MIQQQQTSLSYILLLYFPQSLLLEGHAVPEHKALKRIQRGNVAGRKLKKKTKTQNPNPCLFVLLFAH